MASVFEVGSSALRHIIANPLGTRRRSHENDARELADIVERIHDMAVKDEMTGFYRRDSGTWFETSSKVCHISMDVG